MTEQKWAPGPWDVDEDDFSIHQIETSDIVAECFGPVNDLLATARLIAAAPDLYAALDWVENGIPAECFRDDETTQVVFTGKDLKAFAKARRKARGE